MPSLFRYPKIYFHPILHPTAFVAILLVNCCNVMNGAGEPDHSARLNFGTYPGEPGFIKLFNGKDLTGWDGQPGSWTVEDGVIQCTGKGKARNWLIWRGFGAADFELRLDFRYRKGNSGVQVRSSDLGDWQVRGYQVEVSPPEGMGLWHHSLMSPDIEIQNTRKHLATAGQRVTIAEDGKKVVDQFEKRKPSRRITRKANGIPCESLSKATDSSKSSTELCSLMRRTTKLAFHQIRGSLLSRITAREPMSRSGISVSR
jgi:hypothetical protein